MPKYKMPCRYYSECNRTLKSKSHWKCVTTRMRLVCFLNCAEKFHAQKKRTIYYGVTIPVIAPCSSKAKALFNFTLRLGESLCYEITSKMAVATASIVNQVI